MLLMNAMEDCLKRGSIMAITKGSMWHAQRYTDYGSGQSAHA